VNSRRGFGENLRSDSHIGVPAKLASSQQQFLTAGQDLADEMPVTLPPSRPVPWSKSDVLERLGDDEDLLRELCGIFLHESAKLLQKLRQAILEGDPGAVMRAAHSLKGEVSDLSAPAATRAARRLEDMGHDHDISHAPEAFAIKERELAEICRAILEFSEAASQ